MADIPESAITEKFLAGTGPGGQNVNKVATACQLRVNVYALGLDPDAYKRLKLLAGSRMTGEGELIILARRFRTQEANRADARARLNELVDAARMSFCWSISFAKCSLQSATAPLPPGLKFKPTARSPNVNSVFSIVAPYGCQTGPQAA